MSVWAFGRLGVGGGIADSLVEMWSFAATARFWLISSKLDILNSGIDAGIVLDSVGIC
jgi:hypothetical protein